MASFVALTATVFLFFGSYCGLVIAEAFGSTNAICDLMQLADRGSCPTVFRIGSLDFAADYGTPLLTYYALPFYIKTWISIALALNIDAVRWPSAKRRQPFEGNPTVPSLAPVAATASMSFIILDTISKKAFDIRDICVDWRANCIANIDTDFLPFQVVLFLLGNLLDPWLNLSHILSSSLGNQFQLDRLYPLIMALFGLWTWRKEGNFLSKK